MEQEIAEAHAVWRDLAPRDVQHDIKLLDGHLRERLERGMTVEMFREALEVAFSQPGVTKRNALAYAFGIVRRRLEQ